MPTPRKSLDEHKLVGTRPHYVDEDSDVVPGRPHYPKNLSIEARRFFKAICRTLERRRTLTEGDQELIRLAAVLRDRHERAIAHVAAEGEVYAYTRLDSNGGAHDIIKENLWLRVAKDAERQTVSILDRLGLTPYHRSKIKPTKKDRAQEPAAFPSREEAAQSVEPEPDLNTIDETVVM